MRKKIIILAYHGITEKKINPPENYDGKHVDVEKFKAQVEYLLKKYNVISFEDYLYARNGAKKLPDNPVIVTFDDGYRNNYKVLFPLIKKYKLPVTIFIPTDLAGSEDVPWLGRLEYSILTTNQKMLRIEKINKTYKLSTDKDRVIACIEVKSLLKNIHVNEALLITKEIEKTLATDFEKCNKDNYKIVSWNEVIEMHNAGVQFASHTATHPIMTSCTEDEVINELSASGKKIKEKLNLKDIYFSYPDGRYNEKIIEILRKEGYCLAVTTHKNTNSLNENLFKLNRISVSNNQSMRMFIFNLLGY